MVKKSPAQWALELDTLSIERTHGLPKGILQNLIATESSGDAAAVGPKTKYGQALGLCQFLPATAREVKCDPMVPESAVKGAATYLERLMDRFGGDIEKAVAAYNWGPGNLNRLLKKHPDDWKNYLPDETKNYVSKLLGGVGKTYGQRVASNDFASDDDRRAADAEETTRRKNMMRELGLNPDSLGGKILEAFFYCLVQPFLDHVFEKMGQSMSDTASKNGATIPDGTAVSPSPAPRTAAAPRSASVANG